MVCRVNFARLEQKSFRAAAVCSAGDRRYEQSGRVSSVGSNRYRGYVFNRLMVNVSGPRVRRT